MSTRQDRQEIDFRDTSTTAAPGASESPDELAESPTVNQPEVSPAAAARAALPDQPQAGWQQDTVNNPPPVRNPDAGAVLTERAPGVDPGAPLGPSTGPLPADDLPPAGARDDEADVGLRMPGAVASDLVDHGGTVPGHSGAQAALDETTGTDELPTRESR